MSALRLLPRHSDADLRNVVALAAWTGDGAVEDPIDPELASSVPRILVVDDSPAIRADYRKILTPEDGSEFDRIESSLFGKECPDVAMRFEVDCAEHGQQGIGLAAVAEREGRPYALAFVDMLMPPGLDGIQTALKLWEVSPDLQIVISTAFSQESWPDALNRLGDTDRLLILKKPFEPIEVQQLARALTKKWALARRARMHVRALEAAVAKRTNELVAANEKLEEQAALLNKAQDAIIVWDLDGAVHFWNTSAERLYERPAAEIVGHRVDPVFHDAARQFLEARRVTLAEGAWQGELPHTTTDGRTLSIEGRWTLVLDDHGAPRSILAIHSDITEKKELGARFFRAQRLESIGTLAGGIAHDLNNMLTPIVMGVGMLQQKCVDPGNLTLIEHIGKSAFRGAEMVRQVLLFARGAGGERRLMQPGVLIRDVEKIVRDTFPKGIHCVASVAQELSNVQGDATQLHQVLLNLCVNARDAMPAGGDLTITAENVQLDACYSAMNGDAKPGMHILIQVRDSGTGMPPEIVEKIFDPFFTTKELGKGTGLGLSTSLGIVKSHGGFLQVITAPGEGTTFRIYLPAQAGGSIAPETSNSLPASRGHGECILVVEDEAQIRSLTAQLLDAAGYRVLTAADGVEAVAVFAREGQRIAAVVTDLMMPEMDGSTMVQILVKMDPRVKVIAASGLSASTHDPALATHLRHFLPKPFTAESLLRALAETLENTDPIEAANGLN